ncbi:MAG: tRNA (adenine-N1)-methyltransferase [Desulfohalobiaceae bacterium]
MIEPGELIQLVSPKGKRYLKQAWPDEVLHTHDGALEMTQVLDSNFGSTVHTHLGRAYRILKPTLYDLLKNVKRKTQIIYPKEIGYILLKLGIRPGSTVIEAGSGSGALTVAFSWYVGSTGKVYSFEYRQEFFDLCAWNLDKYGVKDNVQQHLMDIEQGFGLQDIDAAFLDVRIPEDYLPQLVHTLLDGAPVGFLLPTMNQVSNLLFALEKERFTDLEVLEIFLRRYKPVAERLRPEDRMVAHTGYLVFARVQSSGQAKGLPEEDQDVDM